jgi:2',3'-cyclic-nucleotide 2'-phosphodiesterase (5'-nucleotidase family)
MGIIAVTLPFNKANYVLYDDIFISYKRHYEAIKDSCDFVISTTHLNVGDDHKLATFVPQVQLIMGGHDHENMIFHENGVTLAKADANAKSAYIHRLHFDKKTKKLTVKSELRKIDNTLPDDPATKAIADKWEVIAQEKLKEAGFNPKNVVYVAKEPLDGREATIRNNAANLPKMVADAMLASCKGADCALLNSGSIRIDDIVRGNITEFDIVRILPFGGSIELVEMKGSLLQKALETGLRNKGMGGFLQWAAISQNADKWIINNAPIDPAKVYKVAIADFLMTGGEANMSFLKHDNPELLKFQSFANDKTDIRRDVRLALIDYMKKLK